MVRCRVLKNRRSQAPVPGSPEATGGLMNRLLRRLVQLVEDAAVVEELGLRHAPAAELLDGRQLDLGEVLGVGRGDLRIQWAVVVLGDDFLRFRGIEITQ